jgi:hypothetical protein
LDLIVTLISTSGYRWASRCSLRPRFFGELDLQRIRWVSISVQRVLSAFEGVLFLPSELLDCEIRIYTSISGTGRIWRSSASLLRTMNLGSPFYTLIVAPIQIHSLLNHAFDIGKDFDESIVRTRIYWRIRLFTFPGFAIANNIECQTLSENVIWYTSLSRLYFKIICPPKVFTFIALICE